MLALAPGERAVITGFPVGEGHTATATFERIEIYDDSARIIAVTAQGETELPRSELRFFLGYAADTGAHIGLSIDPHTGELRATVRGALGDFRVDGHRLAAGVALESTALRQQAEDGPSLDFRCGNDKVDHAAIAAALQGIDANAAATDAPASVNALSGPLRKVVVAVDTDGELINAPVFGGNTTTATNFIAQLVVEMNVMYERDLNLRLLQGTTYLNTNAATDPYVVTDTPAFLNNINEFGNYWFANHKRVFRHFAMLLSGKSSGQFSASGFAWIDAYCAKGSSTTVNGVPSLFGSYSVNQIFTFAGTTAAQIAPLVAHELGHNLGSPHTHCNYPTNGNVPLDNCYTGDSGCFSGTPVCPGVANGNKGTLMSYCNYGPSNGANCGTNNFKLDYTSQVTNPVQTQMNNRMTAAANFATCVDRIYNDTNE